MAERPYLETHVSLLISNGAAICVLPSIVMRMADLKRSDALYNLRADIFIYNEGAIISRIFKVRSLKKMHATWRAHDGLSFS